jgi:hypothetical protein
MPRVFPCPSHIGNAQEACGVAQAAPVASKAATDKPSSIAKSPSKPRSVLANQSRMSFVALMVGTATRGDAGNGGMDRLGPDDSCRWQCIQPPDFAGRSDWTRIHSTQPSANTRHQSGFLQTGHGFNFVTRV